MDIFSSFLALVLACILCPVVYTIFKWSMKEKTYDECKAEQRKEFKAKPKHQSTKKLKKTEKDKDRINGDHKTKLCTVLNDINKDFKKDELTKSNIFVSTDKSNVSKKKSNKGNVLKSINNAAIEERVHEGKNEIPRPEICTSINANTVNTNDLGDTCTKNELEILKTENVESEVVEHTSVKNLKPKVEEKNKEFKSKQKTHEKMRNDIDKSSINQLRNGETTTSYPNQNDNLNKKSENDGLEYETEKNEITKKIINGQQNAVSKTNNLSHGLKQRSASNNKNSKKHIQELQTLQEISKDNTANTNVNLLIMPLLAKSELTRSEIQELIDLLLNKQQENGDTADAEWIGGGRQDPLPKLKKQLAEKEKALLSEQNAHMAIQNKLKEVRNELNTEKQTNRQREEALINRQTELDEMNAKLKILMNEKHNLSEQCAIWQTKFNEERHLTRTFNEEKGTIHQELIKQRKQLESHIQAIEEQHKKNLISLNAQVNSYVARLQDHETTIAQTTDENVMYRDRFLMLEQQNGILQQNNAEIIMQLDETKNLKSILEHEISSYRSEMNRLSNELNMKIAIIQNMKIENEELQKENTRNGEQIQSTYEEKLELESQIDNLNNELNKLNGNAFSIEDRDKLLNELNTYRNTLNETRIQKDELEHRVQLLEKLSHHTESLDTVLHEKNQEIIQLKQQLDKQNTKNDDLRNKNWAAMDALSEMQKTLENTVQNHENNLAEVKLQERSKLYATLKDQLNSLDELNPPDSYEDTIWSNYVREVLEKVENIISQVTANSNSVSKENIKFLLSELEVENRKLKGMVDNYQHIISETECTLNSLQTNVEQEEHRWLEQVRLLNKQIQSLNEENNFLRTQYPAQINGNCNEVNILKKENIDTVISTSKKGISAAVTNSYNNLVPS